jgi:hypothetical protein
MLLKEFDRQHLLQETNRVVLYKVYIFFGNITVISFTLQSHLFLFRLRTSMLTQY